MKFQLAAALFGLVLVLPGCTSESDVPGPAPQSQGASSEPGSSATSGTQKRGPVPVGLRVDLPAPKARPDSGGIVVDLTEAVQAPSLEEAPVRAGMLLAQLSLFSTDSDYEAIGPGQPYLMTRAGKWRRFDLTRYGFGESVYGELSMAISSDGRHVAFADPSRLVTLDLPDNAVQRFDLPVHHAVALQWSADASTLYLKDRLSRKRPCGPKGCALDVSTGRLSSVPFSLFFSAPSNTDVVFEVKAATKNQPVRLTSYRDGMQPATVPLQNVASDGSTGPPVAADNVAYVQCSRSPREAGALVVDPRSGEVISMLVDKRRPACRLGARSWLNDHLLLVDDYVSGDMWLWDITQRRVRHAAVGRTTGVSYSVASEVMARRFK